MPDNLIEKNDEVKDSTDSGVNDRRYGHSGMW